MDWDLPNTTLYVLCVCVFVLACARAHLRQLLLHDHDTVSSSRTVLTPSVSVLFCPPVSGTDPQFQMSCTVEGIVCYAYSCCDSTADKHLAAQFLKYLSNFAATGNPNRGPAGSTHRPDVSWPAWQSAGSSDGAYINIGDPETRSARISAGAGRVREAQLTFWAQEAIITAGDLSQPCSASSPATPGCGGAGGPAPPCAAGQWVSCDPNDLVQSTTAAAICAANAPPPPPPPAPPSTPQGPAVVQGSTTSNVIVMFLLVLFTSFAAVRCHDSLGLLLPSPSDFHPMCWPWTPCQCEAPVPCLPSVVSPRCLNCVFVFICVLDRS